MMVTLWFFLVCAMFTAYVVLDGYDLGAGISMPFVAKTDVERRAVIHTIAPFWDGNEVFLVAGGASLYLAFPRIFPTVISGFYLPVVIVLWLLALRGIAIEMRHKLDQPLWNELWDGGFFLSSALLVAVFGAALGNVVRGVSVDEHAQFFAPLWTNFRVGADVGILDWYTVLSSVTALATIGRHGALRLASHCSDGEAAERSVKERASKLAERLLFPSAGAVVATTVATFVIQPNARENAWRPWILLSIALVVGGGVGSAVFARKGDFHRAFQGSSVLLIGLLGCACGSVHPYGLLARIASRSILAADAAADGYALQVGLAWWLPGMVLVVGYTVVARRKLLAGDRS